MVTYNKDRVFILKRTPYREQHYLLDIFHKQHGKFRASARIPRCKTYRLTDDWALFQELLVDGQRKTELATLWHSESIRQFPQPQKTLLAAYYLNELLINYLPPDDPARDVYDSYTKALSTPSRQSYRRFEFTLLEHLGLIPDIAGHAAHYRLTFEHDMPTLIPSSHGFDGDFVNALRLKHLDIIFSHPQTKSLFQQILNHQKPLPNHTRNITRHIGQLRSKPPL